ncbi:polyphosphate:AMP phosphotransferase [Thioalkalicoccus limnaeus]|uniref:Polyphosphate:AMP phosphotransferase n=1 Tax=Thioalkalicoccus limnaeus TaxID=120681 RepID=A0ABV4BIG5_9GAMM
MFEGSKIGRFVSKEDYRREQSDLRTELLVVQRELRQNKIPVMILLAGIEGAGKGEVTNRLNLWLDTRHVQTHAFWDETDEERARPRYWRFWRVVPARGEMAILFGAWYQDPIEQRFRGLCTDAELDMELARIVDFERMLVQDGALIVKFWFHMAEADQKARLKALSRDDRSRWKMLPDKAKFSQHYQEFERIGERVILHTDRGISPWFLVEATDRRYRDLTVGKTLLEAIRTRLDQTDAMEPSASGRVLGLPDVATAQVTLIDQLDMTLALPQAEYRSELKRLQADLNELAWQAYKAKRSTVLVFEGLDAAGKGGAIRRITGAIDARLFRTIPIAAPTDEETAHHYLWRFWRQIPRAGYITIYDRSWYGRVLVERVEDGLASDAEWRRAYTEINLFEEQLAEHGIILVKFWLQVSQDEQLRRFEERERVPYKRYKINAEDWRNRERWPLYKPAINEMVTRTSTEFASWNLIEANDKCYARIKVLRLLCEQIKKGLEQGPVSVRATCGARRIDSKSGNGRAATEPEPPGA